MFDLNKVSEIFEKSLLDGNSQVSVDQYASAFLELNKFFDSFGTIFGMVTSDSRSKCSILRQRCSGPEAEHYRSVDSMLLYELDEGGKEKSGDQTRDKKRANLDSGSRTLLRLQWTLEYLVELFDEMVFKSPEEDPYPLTKRVYLATLGRHHPSLVRYAVRLMLYMMPGREAMLANTVNFGPEDVRTRTRRFIDSAGLVSKIVAGQYRSRNALELP